MLQRQQHLEEQQGGEQVTFKCGLRLLAAEQHTSILTAAVEQLCPPHLRVKEPLGGTLGDRG